MQWFWLIELGMQMLKSFLSWQPEQTTLLPPSPSAWLSDRHQVYFRLDLVDELDLSPVLIPAQADDPRGETGFDPRMSTKLSAMRLRMRLLSASRVGIVSSCKADQVCEWVAAFVDWSNHRHRHSGIKFVTRHQRHSGAATAICQQRTDVYQTALRANPTCWNQSTLCWRQPEEVRINKPPEEEPGPILALQLIQST